MKNYENHGTSLNNLLNVSIESITSSKTKKIKNKFNRLSHDVWAKKL
jgi:hypothetical protein